MRLPTEDRLQYVKLIAETALVLILLPLILFGIFRDPHHAADRAIGKKF